MIGDKTPNGDNNILLPDVIQGEKVSFGEATLVALAVLNSETQFEVAALVGGGALKAADLEATMPLDVERAKRGIRSISILETAARKDKATSDYVEWLNQNNSEVRTIPIVPLRMILVDRKVAVLQADPADVKQGTVIYREPGAVNAFVALFYILWAQASVWGQRFSASDNGISNDEKTILELLAIGCRYAEVASRLGLDESTVRRKAKALAKQLGAETPFETAYKATKKGWL